MQIEQYSSGLRRSDEGIYFSAPSGAEVSYAAGGHAECFGVEDSSFWFRHRNDCIAAMVGRHGCEGALLDVGGGNGYVAERLKLEGLDVVLLEPGEEGARNARLRRHLDQVICSTLEAATFREGAFGAAGLFDVIEHVDNDRVFLDSVRTTLAPGGKLYLTVPCHSWLWSQADVEAGHFRRHTYGSIEKMLDGLFQVDYMSYFFAPLVVPQYLLRALPHRLGLTKDKGVLSTEAEHGTGDGLATRAIGAMLRREVPRVAAGKSISFGASCLVAATRL